MAKVLTMLDERPFRPEGPAALVAFENVSWGVKVLVKTMLASKCPIAFEVVSW